MFVATRGFLGELWTLTVPYWHSGERSPPGMSHRDA